MDFRHFITLLCYWIFILDPVGGLKYSIKLLSKEEENTYNYTNANGRTIYQRCESPCNTDKNSLQNFIREEIDDELKL